MMPSIIRLFNINHKKEKALFGFITGESIRQRAQSAIQAVYLQSLLLSRKSLRETFANSAQECSVLKKHVHHLVSEAEARPTIHLLWDSFNKAIAFNSWKKARAKNDFSVFAPKFQKIIDAVCRIGEYKRDFMGFPSAYDARLDRLTPGMSVEYVDQFRDEIMPHRERLQSLPEKYRDPESNAFAFSEKIQKQVVEKILQSLGLNDTNTELHDGDFHPLAFLMDGKLHLTYQSNSQDIVQTVLDIVHEAGHGLFRLHMDNSNRIGFLNMIDTHYNGPDEATALFMDQYVCRSPEFAEFLQKTIREACSEQNIPTPSVNQIYRRLISDDGKLSRLTATAARYPFFLFQYHDIAKKLFSGEAKARDIPELWEETSLRYHGRYVGDDVNQNALQDPHWCSGELGRFAAGYFPGLLMAAQLYKKMNTVMPSAMKRVRTGDFSGVLKFAKEAMYSQDKRDHFQDFIRNATGQELSAKAFIDIEMRRGHHPYAKSQKTAVEPKPSLTA